VIEQTVTVINEKGLHARCASQLVEVAKRFTSTITLRRGTQTANAKSIIGLMLMEAIPGTELQLEVEGADEVEAADAIGALFSSGFGEQGSSPDAS